MNQQQVKTVSKITLSVEQKNMFTLNLIEFTDGYKGLERNDGAGSSFKEGQQATVSIVSPGKGMKTDWIARVFSTDEVPPLETISTLPSTSFREFLIVQQCALTNAVSYANAQSYNGKTHTIGEVLRISEQLAEGTIASAIKNFKNNNHV